jgi:Ca2+-binding RTX toxin-like protein
VIDGSNGDDILAGRGGADTLTGGSGSDTLSYGTSAAGVSINLGTGAASGGDATGDTFSSIENVNGSGVADTLIGSSGANQLNGGLGNDTLTGGGAADIFQFTTAPGSGNVDTITDMTVGSDLISLATSIYSALQAGPTPGSLAASSFRYSTQASTSGGLGEIIYNATTGSLSYDADGSGAGAAKQFAQVSSYLALSASSFRLA